MGVSKKMEIEEMDRISREEYDDDDRAKNDDAAFVAKENHEFDMERQTLVELERDMNTVQKAAYAHLSEGMTMAKERITLIKSIMSNYTYGVKNNG